MGRRLLLTLGWVWPFVVAAAGVTAIYAGHDLHNNQAAVLLFLAALLGSPAVVATIVGTLPGEWSPATRYGVATLFAAPVLALELILAFWLLNFGAIVAGPGLIE